MGLIDWLRRGGRSSPVRKTAECEDGGEHDLVPIGYCRKCRVGLYALTRDLDGMWRLANGGEHESDHR